MRPILPPAKLWLACSVKYVGSSNNNVSSTHVTVIIFKDWRLVKILTTHYYVGGIGNTYVLLKASEADVFLLTCFLNVAW